MKSCHDGCGGSRSVCGSIHGSCMRRIEQSLLANAFNVIILPLKQFSCATVRVESSGGLSGRSASTWGGAMIVGD